MTNNFNEDFLNLSIHEDEYERNSQPLNQNSLPSSLLPPDFKEETHLVSQNELCIVPSTFSKIQISEQDLNQSANPGDNHDNQQKKKVVKSQSSIKSSESQSQSRNQSQIQPIEETKELAPQIPQNNKFAQRRKFDGEEIKEDLKKLRLTIQEDTEKVKGSSLIVKYQRKYTEQTKQKALELSGQIGPHSVAVKTGIPESTIRRWQKIGL